MGEADAVTRIQFGWIMPGDKLREAWRATYAEDLRRALNLIAGRFDSAWMIDHLQFDDQYVLEGFTALTYAAALEPRLRVGHTVICQSFRKPALLAKMGATLQWMSGGRFMLGIGAGWHEEEYRAYGYDFHPDGVRVDQLEEAIQIIKALWTQPVSTFEGKHYRVLDARCEPKPVPVPPIIIGAFRPRMLRITAEYADGWNVSSTGPTEYRGMLETFERMCLRVGRDPASVRRSWGGGCTVARTQAEAERIAGDLYSPTSEEDFGFVGTPEQVIAQMRPFIEMGIDTFMLDCGGFPDLTTLDLMAREVLPALNS